MHSNYFYSFLSTCKILWLNRQDKRLSVSETFKNAGSKATWKGWVRSASDPWRGMTSCK